MKLTDEMPAECLPPVPRRRAKPASERLYRVGPDEPNDELAAIETMVAQYRLVAATHLGELGIALNTWSNRLAELGRTDEALAVIEEAVEACRHAAATDPTNYLPELAMSLNNLSVRSGEVGQTHAALAAREEADALFGGAQSPVYNAS